METSYPLVFFDAIRVKIRDEGLVRNKAVYLALGVAADGTKDILGLWIETTEGAKFWLKVMNELKARGVEDILIAVVDGLKGFPEAIEAVFPQAAVQTCIVHLIRNSLDFVVLERPQAHRRRAAQNLPRRRRRGRPQGPGGLREQPMGPKICGNWPNLAAALGAGRPVLRLRSGGPENHLHHERDRGLERQTTASGANRGHFPSDEAATKLIFLVLRQVVREWKMPPREWAEAKTQFAIMFGERFVRT